MPTTEYDGPEEQEDVTVFSVREVNWINASSEKILVIVSREGMRVTSRTAGSTTTDPRWETGTGDDTGYKQYRYRFDAEQLADPEGSKYDFPCTATLDLHIHSRADDKTPAWSTSRPVTFAAGQRTQAIVFDKFEGNFPNVLVARLRDPKIDPKIKSRALRGIEAKQTGSSDKAVEMEVEALKAKHSGAEPSGPDFLFDEESSMGLYIGPGVAAEPIIYRVGAMQSAKKGDISLL
ncbi:hypothetical protein [Streptomyces sp. NPDC058623]|uniref:hypothetical protein n=1 Tax=Streptomyces sp. NPDC058623 TaxID=3346563 RepID=UPI00364D7FDD